MMSGSIALVIVMVVMMLLLCGGMIAGAVGVMRRRERGQAGNR
jgi:hypothetical protein